MQKLSDFHLAELARRPLQTLASNLINEAIDKKYWIERMGESLPFDGKPLVWQVVLHKEDGARGFGDHVFLSTALRMAIDELDAGGVPWLDFGKFRGEPVEKKEFTLEDFMKGTETNG